jgi:filamentous hemagglutinin
LTRYFISQKNNAKYFQRTIYGYRPHRAFQATKNFAHIKKKQYIVLDGLHKNHLELYNSNKEWLGVINFDGTLNKHLTTNGSNKLHQKLKEM